MKITSEELHELIKDPAYEVDIWYNTEYYIANGKIGYGKYAKEKISIRGFGTYWEAAEQLMRIILMIRDGT